MFERIGELDHVVFTAGDAFTPRPLADSRHGRRALGSRRALLGRGRSHQVRSSADPTRGSIALTTGTVGQRPVPGAALAAAGAGAAEGLVRGLAAELAPVACQRGRAGAIRTPMWDGIPEPQREALFARLAQGTCLERSANRSRLAARARLPHAEPLRHRNGADRRRRPALDRELNAVRMWSRPGDSGRHRAVGRCHLLLT